MKKKKSFIRLPPGGTSVECSSKLARSRPGKGYPGAEMKDFENNLDKL
jgi:hypothetical protein